jgi:hypothetical protein
VTHFVRNSIKSAVATKSTVDYHTLLKNTLDGIKSGYLTKPASCLIIHSIIKAELMNLYKTQGFSNWREVCCVLNIKTPSLKSIQTELGNIRIGIKEYEDGTTPRRGRPRKLKLDKPKRVGPVKRPLSPENKQKLLTGLRLYHARRKLDRAMAAHGK